MTWLRRLFGRRPAPPAPAPPMDAAQAAAETAAVVVELRLLSHRLSRTASDLARIHGVERRASDNG